MIKKPVPCSYLCGSLCHRTPPIAGGRLSASDSDRIQFWQKTRLVRLIMQRGAHSHMTYIRLLASLRFQCATFPNTSILQESSSIPFSIGFAWPDPTSLAAPVKMPSESFQTFLARAGRPAKA